MKRIGLAVFILLLFSVSAVSFEPFIETEQGTIAILHHTYKNGSASTDSTMSTFDFVAKVVRISFSPFPAMQSEQPLLIATELGLPTSP